MSNGFLGKVELLEKESLERRLLCYIYASAKNCYSPLGSAYFFKEANELYDTDRDKLVKFCMTLIKFKHRTTLTHQNFSFSIEGASRSCVDQLVRSQVGTNFDVMSQRYVNFVRKEELATMPWNVHLENEDYLSDLSQDLRDKLSQLQRLTKEAYTQMIHEGKKPAEEARWLLTMDMPTNLMATYNIVSFRHLCDTRLFHSTGKAQGEIENMTRVMRDIFVEAVPSLKEVYDEPTRA